RRWPAGRPDDALARAVCQNPAGLTLIVLSQEWLSLIRRRGARRVPVQRSPLGKAERGEFLFEDGYRDAKDVGGDFTVAVGVGQRLAQHVAFGIGQPFGNEGGAARAGISGGGGGQRGGTGAGVFVVIGLAHHLHAHGRNDDGVGG